MKKIIVSGLIFLLVNLASLHNDHAWGDDFAQYLIHARNLVSGAPYMSGVGLEPYAALPPGLPLILAALLKAFGPDFFILKLPNVFFWFLTTLFLYALMKDRLRPSIAALGAMLMFSSYYFFAFKQHILTDVPFMFFVTAALYAFTQYGQTPAGKQKNVILLLALLALLGAVSTRWAGVILIASAAFYFSLIKRDAKALIGLGLVLLALVFITGQVGFTTHAYQKALVVDPAQWVRSSFRQLLSLPLQVTRFFLPSPVPENYTALIAQMFKLGWIQILAAIGIFAGVVVVFIRGVYRRSITFIGCFFAIYYFGYIIWWIPADGRYMLPIIGLFIIFGSEAFVAVYTELFHRRWKIFTIAPERIVQAALSVMIAFNLFNITLHFRDREEGIRSPEVLAMTAWMAGNLRADEHFMHTRPRTITWLSGRTGAAFVSPQNKDPFAQRVQQLDVDYLVLNNAPEAPSAYLEVLRELSIPYRSVYQNKKFVIYKIK